MGKYQSKCKVRSNPERKGNLATTSVVEPQCHKPGHTQQLFPSTSSERITRSSSKIQSKSYVCTLINTHNQSSKQNQGQLQPSGPSTSRQRSNAEIQSDPSKPFAPALRNNNDQRNTQTPGQSSPSVLSTQSNNPSSRGTVKDHTNANDKKLADLEFVNCGSGSTTAVKQYPQSILQRKNKLAGEYQHGPLLNESSGNPDDPLDIAGTTSVTHTEPQSTMDHGDSYTPHSEAGGDIKVRPCKEIEYASLGEKHSSASEQQTHGILEKEQGMADTIKLERDPIGYRTHSKMSLVNIDSAKSAEERKKNIDKEKLELHMTHDKITGKQSQISSPSSQSRPTPVATPCSSAQDVCSQNNNHEKKVEDYCSVNSKDSVADKMEMDKSSGRGNSLSDQTTQKPNICNSYFNRTPTGSSSISEYADAIKKSSDVSHNNLPRDVGSVLDSGKDLDKPCKVDSDLDNAQIDIPNYFLKKAKKEKDPTTYLKDVKTSVQVVIRQLYNGSKQAEELLEKSQNLQWASKNVQQLLDDYKSLHEKVLSEVEKAIKKWDHPPYNEQLEKFKQILHNIELCLQTCSKKIVNELARKNLEAGQLRSKSCRTIEPLSELCYLKEQIETLRQELLEIPNLKIVDTEREKINENLQVASENVEKNINLLKDIEEKCAATKIFINMDLETVKGCEIESLLPQLTMAIKALSELNLFKYRKEWVKKYHEALKTLKQNESILKGKRMQFVAQKEFEDLVSLAKDLKNQASNNKDNGLKNATLIKSIESSIEKLHTFLAGIIFYMPETDKESTRKTIREHVDTLRKIHKILSAHEEFEDLVSLAKDLKNQASNNKNNGLENATLIKSIESALVKVHTFLTSSVYYIPETDKESSRKTIREHEDTLKKILEILKAYENLKTLDTHLKSLLRSSDSFGGTLRELQNLISQLERLQHQYQQISTCGQEAIQTKVNSSISSLQTCIESLKLRQPVIEANESFKKSYSQTSILLKEIDTFCGPSSELETLFQNLNEALKYYSAFPTMSSEKFKRKLVDVQREISNAHDNLKSRQPIIEAHEKLAIIRGRAEELQKKVSGFQGDMSSLRNYMREVEKLQSNLSNFDTIDSDMLKKEAATVSQTIKSTLLSLESFELQLESEDVAASMAIEECAEQKSPDMDHLLKESSSMEWICNITMQLMSIYRQLSNNGINVMDSDHLRWLNVRTGDLEVMLANNNIKPKTAHEEKAVYNAEKLCLLIQQMIADKNECSEVAPELFEIRATAIKALELHTKIFQGDVTNNQIHWLETQLIECQSKMDRLQLPEGVARESRKDVLNLCNQALSALKKHSYCEN